MIEMNWLVIYPELLLLVLACAVALVDLFVTDPKRRPTFWLAQASLAQASHPRGAQASRLQQF